MPSTHQPVAARQREPLVSVIVPTRNSAEFLEECLSSIAGQSYANTEIIVVDNGSTDGTLEIAKRFTNKTYTINSNPPLISPLPKKEPETVTSPSKGASSKALDLRSAQRNYGAQTAKGDFLLFVDSDMKLDPEVISDCVKKITANQNTVAIIIPEESVGIGFWSKCKQLERSFYVGVDWMEAARFYKRKTFEQIGGYDQKLVSGEDWDLSQRAAKLGKIERIEKYIFHNEGRISLIKTVKKKYYYAGEFAKYIKKEKSACFTPDKRGLRGIEGSGTEPSPQTSGATPTNTNLQNQTGIIARYKLFFSRPSRLLKNPLLGAGMLFMKTCEFGVGGVGYLLKK